MNMRLLGLVQLLNLCVALELVGACRSRVSEYAAFGFGPALELVCVCRSRVSEYVYFGFGPALELVGEKNSLFKIVGM